MMHHDVLRQLTHERCERYLREAEAHRFALQVRRQRQRRTRRLALNATRELRLRGRRQGTHA